MSWTLLIVALLWWRYLRALQRDLSASDARASNIAAAVLGHYRETS